MSGSTTLYTFSIEGIEGTVNIVAYTITDAEDTLKEWLNPGVKIKLLHKDKVTLGKEYRKLNIQDSVYVEDIVAAQRAHLRELRKGYIDMALIIEQLTTKDLTEEDIKDMRERADRLKESIK